MFHISSLLLFFVIELATGFDRIDLKEEHPCLTVDNETQIELSYMVYQQKVEFIQVSVYIDNELLSTVKNESVDPVNAVPPYYAFVWVNKDGLEIYKMDYRFRMWSLGTLKPSVKYLDFKLNSSECYSELNLTQKFSQMYHLFKSTLLHETSYSRPVADFSYLCHRHERYEGSEHCLGTKCHMMTLERHLKDELGFCSEQVNQKIKKEKWIWFTIFLIVINSVPLFIFWMREKTTETNKDKNWIKLFAITETNYEHFPWIGRLCYYLFLSHDKYCIFLRAALAYFICFLFFVWWFLLANFVFYHTEYIQRQYMSQGDEDNLLPIEWMFAGIFDSIYFFTVCFVVASLGNIVLVYMLCHPVRWIENKRFLYVPDLSGEASSFLSRHKLLINKNLWIKLWKGCAPKKSRADDSSNVELGKSNNPNVSSTVERNESNRPLGSSTVCIIVRWFFCIILFIFVALLTCLALLLPLVDLVLHIPWFFNNPGSSTETPPDNNPGSSTETPPDNNPGSSTETLPENNPGSSTGTPPDKNPGSGAETPPDNNPGSSTGTPPDNNPGSSTGTPPDNNPGSSTETPPDNNLGSSTETPPDKNPGSSTETPPDKNPGSGAETPPDNNPGSSTGTPPDKNPGSGAETPPDNNPGSSTGTPPDNNPGSSTGTPPENNPGSSTETPPENNPGSSTETPPDNDPGSSTETPPDNNPGSSTETPPDNNPGSTCSTETLPENNPGSSNETPPDNNPGSSTETPPDNNPGSSTETPPDKNPGSSTETPPDKNPGSGAETPPDKNPGSGAETPPDNNPGRISGTPPGHTCDQNDFSILFKMILVLIYTLCFVISYFVPSVQVISVIASYTITGLMKNWDFLLPIIALALIVIRELIKIVYGAFQPMYNLQMTILRVSETVENFDSHKESPQSIMEEDNSCLEGKFYIKKKFLEECYDSNLLLKPAEYSSYSFFAFIKFVALCLMISATGLSLYMLNDNSSLGKVVIAIFLSFLPQALDTLTRPWRADVRQFVKEKYIMEKINKDNLKIHFGPLRPLKNPTITVKTYDIIPKNEFLYKIQ